MAILENVVFAFVKIQKPVKSLNEGDTEFTVDVIVDKATAKQWNKDHPKNKYKSIDNDDFLEKFKFDEVPFDDQDEQFVIKFKKAHSKGGELLPEKFRPRVFQADPDGGKPTDITFETLVANGSRGKVSFSTFINKTYGEFVQLDAILVEDLIPYESAGGTPGSDFGVSDKDLAPAPKNQKAVTKQTDDEDADEEDDEPAAPAPKAAAKPAKPAAKPAKVVKKPAADVEEAEDNDSPF